MAALLATALNPSERFFLGVEKSATGRSWRDRLDERGQARALAITQRAGVPELLARVLAGRGVEPDDGRRLSRPQHPRADARPACAHRHGGGVSARSRMP